MNWRRLTRLFILASLLSAEGAAAMDLSLGTSFLQSDVRPMNRGNYVTYTGFAPSVGLMLDVSPSLAVSGEIQPLMDFQQRTIARNAIKGGFEVTLIGQTRFYRQKSALGSVSYLGGSSLGFLSEANLSIYQANLGGSAGTLTGQTLSGSVGLRYRFDLSPTMSIGAQAAGTVLSFSNSKEGLESREFSAGAFLRLALQ